MQLIPAHVSDYQGVVELANQAYRGEDGWNSEAKHIQGELLTTELLQRELSTHPHAHLLAW